MFTRVKKYVPLSRVPIAFFLRSTSTLIYNERGWKMYRVVAGSNIEYIWQCGNHIYKEI